MQRHNRATSVRSILGLTGADAESAHVVPQAAGAAILEQFPKGVPGSSPYSPGRALTVLLPPGTHSAFDQGWVSVWNARIAGGAEITAGDVNAMVGAALDQIPASMMSPAAKGSLQWRLFSELFGELGLAPDTVLVPKK